MFLLVNFYWKIIKSWNFTGKTSFKIRFTKFHNFFFYEFQLMIKECLKGHIFVTVTNDEERKMGWEDINGIKGGFQHPSCKLHRWSTHQTLHFKGPNHTRPSSLSGAHTIGFVHGNFFVHQCFSYTPNTFSFFSKLLLLINGFVIHKSKLTNL